MVQRKRIRALLWGVLALLLAGVFPGVVSATVTGPAAGNWLYDPGFEEGVALVSAISNGSVPPHRTQSPVHAGAWALALPNDNTLVNGRVYAYQKSNGLVTVTSATDSIWAGCYIYVPTAVVPSATGGRMITYKLYPGTYSSVTATPKEYFINDAPAATADLSELPKNQWVKVDVRYEVGTTWYPSYSNLAVNFGVDSYIKGGEMYIDDWYVSSSKATVPLTAGLQAPVEGSTVTAKQDIKWRITGYPAGQVFYFGRYDDATSPTVAYTYDGSGTLTVPMADIEWRAWNPVRLKDAQAGASMVQFYGQWYYDPSNGGPTGQLYGTDGEQLRYFTALWQAGYVRNVPKGDRVEIVVNGAVRDITSQVLTDGSFNQSLPVAIGMNTFALQVHTAAGAVVPLAARTVFVNSASGAGPGDPGFNPDANFMDWLASGARFIRTIFESLPEPFGMMMIAGITLVIALRILGR